MRELCRFAMACAFLALPVSYAQTGAAVSPRVIVLTADHDSRYRAEGKVAPTVEAAPGEPLILRITASRATEVARDGSVHGLALLNKDLDAVPGWRFYLHPGVQELAVKAPEQPGRYTAVCTVICSDMHDGMKFTLIVTQRQSKIVKE
ncbi:MAG TPA: hypothetical protein VJO35_03580 [Terriglobales bacterium]|nr:hypothetical protein [Terriglobales bacterium]